MMFTQLQASIPVLQAYLSASDKASFLATLQDPNEKALITLLTSKITSISEFKEQLKRANLHYQIKADLEDYKIAAFLQTAKEVPLGEFLTSLKKKYNVGNFEYTQPAALNAEQPKQGNNSVTSSQLKIEQTLGKHLEVKAASNKEWIKQINEFAFSRVSHETLLALPVADKEYVLEKFSNILFSFNSKFIATFLSMYEGDVRMKNDNYRLTAKVLSSLTKEQLLQLAKVHHSVMSNQDYVELWFNQLYAETIAKHVENSQFFTKQEHGLKRQAFIQIIKDLSHYKDSPIIKKYASKLRAEVLFLDTIVGDPSVERLIEHLQTSNIFQKLQNVTRDFAINQDRLVTNTHEPKFRYRLDADKLLPNVFVEEYIELLLRYSKDGNKTVEQLSKYLQERYLRKLLAKERLYIGENVINSQDYFSIQELQTMRDKKEIRLLPTNPKKFKVEDPVKLDVAIKNVKSIIIKVYVLNLEKHLLGQACNTIIDDEVDLAFLLPTAQQRYQNNATNPFQINYTSIDLSTLVPNKMGVYIVDFQGQTVTSRAVIRKGTIICVDSLTQAGQQFSFFDQSGRPLTEKDSLRVWIRQQPTKLEGNRAFVSYGEKLEYGSVVAALGDYAESFQKKFQEEKYKFEVGYLFGGETFAVGSKAKVLLHGRLTMNGKVMSLELLRGTKVRVIVTNHQNIKTSFAFEFDRWGNAQDLLIQFPVQAYIREISINLETRITLLNKKELTLSSSKEIKFDLGESSSNFLDFYLDQDASGDYRLSLLGANGQPISNADVIIGYNVAGVEETQRKQLRTNAEGQIRLGPLTIVSRFSAEINNSETNIQRIWQIDQSESSYSYSNTIYSKVGQEIVLPVNKRWKAGQILLLRTFDKFYAEDLTSKLSISDGRLKLPKLQSQGYYILKLLPIDRSIEIMVLKDVEWHDNTVQNHKVYNENQGTLYEISHNIFQGVAVKDVQFNQSEENFNVCAYINLDLQGVPNDRLGEIRIHVFANNYLASEINDFFNTQAFNAQPRLEEHYLQVKRSAYYSSKTFSEEQAYVWSRQQRDEHLVGNNLEKPSIFLKKILVRETKINDENLNQDGRYIEECAMMEGDRDRRERAQMKKGGNSARLALGRNALQLNSHNNFLQLSGEVASNLVGGCLKVGIPKEYSSIDVYILTPKTATKSTFSLKTNDEPKLKRDLRHSGLEETEENKGWTMSREIRQLRPGEKRAVNRDSQWRTVSLADIFEFAGTKRVKLFDWSNYLLNWHTYDQARKIEIYDKECCHELNTFLRFKDRPFFDKIVAPFISNKIHKTVVDFCLLNHHAALDYTSLSKLESLNAFEKCLLVHTLLEQKQAEAAQSIVDALELEQKSIKRNYEEYKSAFDTIINAKETEEKAKIMPRAEKMSDNSRRSAPMKKRVESRTESASISLMARRDEKMQEKKAFVAVESTKEYTEKTYCNVTNYKREAPQLVQPSRFWAELARSFVSGTTYFLSESFMFLKTPVEFMLAASFIPSDSSANFQLSNSGDKYEIAAKSPMLVYIKQVKQVEFQRKFGVLINQRFFDPNNRVAYEEDGTEYEREVEEFVIKKGYVCQTVINNTSGTPLQLQILLDIPQGAIPLRSHQYTQILNIRIEPYSSQSFERHFYLPEEGVYSIYPSNASRGSGIIAKAPKVASIVAKKVWTINKLESFEDVLRSGKKEEVIAFLSSRNIFDSNIFRPQQILWMLKDKEFYYEVLAVLRKRRFFNRTIWNFAFLHLDLPTIRELTGFVEAEALNPCAFEYFPYYSSRTHQFANQSKSTIRNVEFKESYIRFLVGSVVGLKLVSFEVTYCYYLILQDRLREAYEILKKLTPEQYKAFEIQYDYMSCFLDLSLNAPNFTVARQITQKYSHYPIQSWNKLFAEARRTIDSQQDEYEGDAEVSSAQVFQTQVIQQPGQFKIIQPAGSYILVEIYEINLELYFSEYPFIEIKTFTSVKPSKVIPLKNLENTIRRADYPDLKDATVEITEVKNGLPRKISTFWWTNPEVKVKVSEKEGTLQAYLNKKRLAGAYVKVFSDKGMTKDFYRDGYTDMTGTFRYAMSDLDGIREFSILVMTDKGGVIHRVKPPSKLSSF